MRGRNALAVLILAAFVVASCGAAPKAPGDPLAGKYALGGGGGAIAVVKALTARFSQLHPGVNFDVQNLDSLQGVTLVADGSLDLGFVSRDLKADEKEKVATEPIGVSGSALAVSSLNPVRDLTRGQARKPTDQYRPHGLLNDKFHYFGAVSSKGHADADLAHAAAYTVGHHSIYADRSKQHC